MKGALFAALGTILVAGALVVAAYLWPTGEPKGALKDSELEWVGGYYEWAADPKEPCETIPAAPTERLRRLARRARAACKGKDDGVAVDKALEEHLFMSRPLPTSAKPISDSHINPPLGLVASRMAEQQIQVRCWSTGDWERVNREYSRINPRVEYWVSGIAQPWRDRIHLEGTACPTLVRFFESRYTPDRTIDRAELAEALLLLAHEVEHMRDRRYVNSEALVECYALQRVRDLVLGEGHTAAFAADIAAWAWEVGYPRGDPVYATERCRNDGPLDRNPTSDVWP